MKDNRRIPTGYMMFWAIAGMVGLVICLITM